MSVLFQLSYTHPVEDQVPTSTGDSNETTPQRIGRIAIAVLKWIAVAYAILFGIAALGDLFELFSGGGRKPDLMIGVLNFGASVLRSVVTSILAIPYLFIYAN